MADQGEPQTAEGFVAAWLAHWGVEWPNERGQQLVRDLRDLTGDRLEFR